MKTVSIVFIFLLITTKASACSCIGVNGVKEEIKSSNLVIAAKIAEISYDTVYVPISQIPIVHLKVVAYVDVSFKGKSRPAEIIEIITGIGNGDCGFPFELNKMYIVYATKKKKHFSNSEKVPSFYYTDMCARTRLIDEDELREIERYRKRKG